MTGNAALAAGAARLRAAGVPDAPRDARRLLAFALGIAADRLTLVLPEALSDAAAARYDAALAARVMRRPVSHIVGTRDFWGRVFRVSADVLDPRPETETLIAAALAKPFLRVLDLGTGSGCILLTLLAERRESTGVGTDISPEALIVARDNAVRLNVEDRAEFVLSDWFAGLGGRFDLVVSNPPYIAAAEMADLSVEVRDYEPHLALTPGGDGLDPYREISARVGGFLTPGGRVIVEIGPTQGAQVAQMFKSAGLTDVEILHDLDGRDRVVSGIGSQVT